MGVHCRFLLHSGTVNAAGYILRSLAPCLVTPYYYDNRFLSKKMC